MKNLKMLAIGNSFSVDSMEYLWDIASACGFKTIILGNLFIGGCELSTHWNNAENNLKHYIYYKNTNGTWLASEKRSIFEALIDEKWDIISLQQASGKSGLKETYQSDLTNLIHYIKTHNSAAELVWNMTWAYEGKSTHQEFVNYGNDQLKMYQSIISAVQEKILSNPDIRYVIPTGTTIQNLRAGLLGDTLTRDGFHLSLDLGRFAAGLTWFVKITGYPVNEISYKPESITNQQFLLIKEAVKNAVKYPYQITPSSHL